MKLFKLDKFLIFIILLNVALIALRVIIGDYATFSGNWLSVLIFAVIFLTLSFFYLTQQWDKFILFWLSFHFAAPAIVLPFTDLGSLGLINGIFIPLMFVRVIDIKNKYFWTVSSILLICVLNLSDAGFRIIFPGILDLIAPFIFFYFVLKKVKNPEYLMKGAILIALLSVPLAIYQIIAHPVGGVFQDWRGTRIVGSLFLPNSYTVYLLAPILLTYFFMRTKFSIELLISFILLLFVNVFTFSRTGMIALFIGLVIFEFFYKRNPKHLMKKTALVFSIVIAVLLYAIFFTSLSSEFTPDSINERTVIWQSVLPHIQGNFLFGNGIGSYEIYRESIIQSLSPHNYYLDVMFEIGIVGLFAILAFLFFLVIDYLTKILNKRQVHHRYIGLALLASLMVVSLVGSGFNQVSALNAWVILGCLLVYSSKKTGENKDAKKESVVHPSSD